MNFLAIFFFGLLLEGFAEPFAFGLAVQKKPGCDALEPAPRAWIECQRFGQFVGFECVSALCGSDKRVLDEVLDTWVTTKPVPELGAEPVEILNVSDVEIS